MLFKQYKSIIILSAVIILMLIGYGLITVLQFRITSTSPNIREYPSSLSQLTFTFNKQLDKKYIEDTHAKSPDEVVSLNFESDTAIEVQDKQLTLTFSQTPVAGRYEISLKNIRDVGGDSFSSTESFIVVNKDYKDLTAEEKRLFDEAAAEAETAENDPLASVLPHETDKYKINYQLPPENVELPATITITMKFFEPGDNALPATPAQRQAYLQDLRTYRRQALAYLESRDVDVNKYIIEYTEIDLRSEFPAGYTPQPHTD